MKVTKKILTFLLLGLFLSSCDFRIEIDFGDEDSTTAVSSDKKSSSSSKSSSNSSTNKLSSDSSKNNNSSSTNKTSTSSTNKSSSTTTSNSTTTTSSSSKQESSSTTTTSSSSSSSSSTETSTSSSTSSPSVDSSSSSSVDTNTYLYDKVEEELNVHYIDLGVSGDSILIDYGNYEILIDAGGNKTAGTNIIVPYLREYVEDNTIELTINTHGHEDHMAGYVGLANKDGVFSAFSYGTIVDPGEGYENLKNNNGDLTDLQVQYNEKRDAKIAEGSTYYTIRDIFDNNLERWTIAPDLTLTFLYQKYYDIPYTKTSQNLNDYSICTLLEYQDFKFLFTGDLEKKGEESLVENNELPEIDVYKAGHHGSDTASNDCLVDMIKPKMSIFTADSLGDTYKFPHPEAIDRLSKYSTTYYASYFNGHIVVNMKKDEKTINVNCSDRNDSFKIEPYLACYPTIEAIAAIGSFSSKSDAVLQKIETAEALYSALTTEQKEYVYNYSKLVTAREKYDKL